MHDEITALGKALVSAKTQKEADKQSVMMSAAIGYGEKSHQEICSVMGLDPKEAKPSDASVAGAERNADEKEKVAKEAQARSAAENKKLYIAQKEVEALNAQCYGEHLNRKKEGRSETTPEEKAKIQEAREAEEAARKQREKAEETRKEAETATGESEKANSVRESVGKLVDKIKEVYAKAVKPEATNMAEEVAEKKSTFLSRLKDKVSNFFTKKAEEKSALKKSEGKDAASIPASAPTPH